MAVALLSTRTTAAAPKAPELTIGDVGLATIKVVWTVPTSNGATITAFNLYYKAGEDLEGATTIISIPFNAETNTDPSYTLDVGLMPGTMSGTTYTIAVSAVNAEGEGSLSAERSTRTLTNKPPGKPGGLEVPNPERTRLTVMWDAPAEADDISMITGYEVYWRIDNLNVPSSMERVASLPRSYTIMGLESSMSYRIEVAAINLAGTGERSGSDVFVTTSVTAPNAPIGLRITAGSTTTKRITVSWSTPDDDGGAAILDYEISWSIEDEAVSSSTVSRSVTSYQIGSSPEQELEAGTLYQIEVSARNIIGQGTPSQSVTERTVADRPSAPGEITATEVTSNSITVSWVVPAEDGGAPITSYRVSWGFGSDSTGEGEADVIPPTTKLVIGGAGQTALLADTEYTIEVRAMNSAGLSEASMLPVSTRPGDVVVPRAPDAPSGLTTRTLAATSLTVVWDAPFDGGAMITSYQVSWGLGAASTGVGTADVIPSTTELVIGQKSGQALLANRAYTIEVRAMNSAGLSEASTLSVRTLRRDAVVPDAPSGLRAETIAATSIRVVWEAPAEDDRAPITSYRIVWVDPSDGGISGMRTTTGVSYTIMGLAPGTLYEITVAAINRVGLGAVASLSTRTSAAAPKAPVLTVVDVGLATIKVMWTVPTSNGATITAFNLYRKAGEDLEGATTIISVPFNAETNTDPSYTFDVGLMPGAMSGTTYTIAVSAVNAEGEGSLSEAKSTTTLTNMPPGKLGGLRVPNPDRTRLTVMWDAPAEADDISMITGYEVYWRIDNLNVPSSMERVASLPRSYTIMGLESSMSYRIEVAAINLAGTGERSEPSVFPTTSVTAPNAPIGLHIIAGSTTTKSITVSWP